MKNAIYFFAIAAWAVAVFTACTGTVCDLIFEVERKFFSIRWTSK